MRKILELLCLLVASTVFACLAQTVHNSTAQSNNGGFIRAIGGASITVCSYSSGNYSSTTGAYTGAIPCTPTTTVYGSQSLSPSSALTQPFSADSNGNYYFWAPSGVNYTVCVTGIGYSGYCYAWSAGNSSGSVNCPNGSSGDVQVYSATSVCASGVVNTANVGISGNVARKNNSTDAVQYVSPSGNDTNDGLSWGTPKLTVYTALCSLPGGNCSTQTAGHGTVYVTTGVSLNPTASAGIWTMGSLDPNYSSPPTGWLKESSGGWTVECFGGSVTLQGSAWKGCTVNGGSSTNPNDPYIWVSNPNVSHHFIGLIGGGGGTLARCVLAGVDSNGNANANGSTEGGAVQQYFEHDGCQPTNGVGYGPAVTVGNSSYENRWYENNFQGNPSEIVTITSASRASNVVTATITGTNPFSVSGEPGGIYLSGDRSFNCQTCTITRTGTSTITYNNIGPNASSTGGEAYSDKAFAVLYPYGMGLDWWTGLFMEGGGGFKIDYSSNAGAGNKIENIESESRESPIIWVTGSYFHQYTFTNISGSDAIYSNLPAVVNAGPPADSVVVIGTYADSTNLQVDGPATVSGMYPNSIANNTISPFSQGQNGFAGGYVFGHRDESVRMGSPQAIRFANTWGLAPSGWNATQSCYTGTCTKTTGLPDPFGGTNAASISATTSGNVIEFNGSIPNLTFSTGDFLVFRLAYQSTGTLFSSGYAGASAAPIIINLQPFSSGTYNVVGQWSGQNAGVGTAKDWYWATIIIQITAGDTFAFGFDGQMQSGNTVVYAYPEGIYIPVSNGMTANDAINYADSLGSFPSTCPVNTVCDLQGDVLSSHVNAITYSTTPALNPTLGKVQQFSCTTSGAAISPTLSGLIPGTKFTVIFVQNGTTACTWTWPSTIHGGMTVSSTLSSINVQNFTVSNNGTDAYADSAGSTGMTGGTP